MPEIAIRRPQFPRAELRKRTVRDGECLRWTGNKRPLGYAMVGRDRTNTLVRRLVPWAEAGFPDDMRSFPQVHHICAVRDCIEPTHLVPATALTNLLEASARKAALRRVELLTEALREADPDNPLLELPPLSQTDIAAFRRGATYESPRTRLKRKIAVDELARKRRENTNTRFQEVIEVRQLIARGVRWREALETVGINRRVYQEWERKFDEWMEDAA